MSDHKKNMKQFDTSLTVSYSYETKLVQGQGVVSHYLSGLCTVFLE